MPPGGTPVRALLGTMAWFAGGHLEVMGAATGHAFAQAFTTVPTVRLGLAWVQSAY